MEGREVMSKIKSELSNSNDDRISKHRYYELKHHCYQYAEWKREAADLLIKSPILTEKTGKTNNITNQVEEAVEKREKILKKVDRIRKLCEEVGGESAYYLLACVTAGYSYDVLSSRYGVIPCSRVEFYKLYRHFFKLLDEELD